MFFLYLFFIYFSLISVADAYIDPGTGSIIIQAIIGFVASILVGASFYWHKFKSFIKKVLKRDKNEKPSDRT